MTGEPGNKQRVFSAPERPEVLPAGGDSRLSLTPADAERDSESIDSPAKVMRIGTMLKQLLNEVRAIELDEASRKRLRQIYEISVTEISSAVSEDLRGELTRLASPFGGTEQGEIPTAAELHVAKAQLVGWLEGLISGMQAMLVAQELAARRQLEAMRGELTAGRPPHAGTRGRRGDDSAGAYL